MPKKKDSGVTLMELIAVIMIMGVLATIAIPQFSRSRERAIGKEAQANLKLIKAAEDIYKMENGSYYGPASASQMNAELKLYLSAANWTYSIAEAGQNLFTARAERNGSGGYLECVYTINQGSSSEPTPDDPAVCPQ